MRSGRCFPRREFVEEIIGGNKEMKMARAEDGIISGRISLLPGFQEEAGGNRSEMLFARGHGRGK